MSRPTSKARIGKWMSLHAASPMDAARGMHELFDSPNGFTAWIAPDGEIRTAFWGDSHAEAAQIVTGIDDEARAFDAMFGAGYVRLRASLWEKGHRSTDGPAEVVVGFAGKPTAAQKRVVQSIARAAPTAKFFWSRWSPDPSTWDTKEEEYGSDIASFVKRNPPMPAIANRTAAALRSVAADPSAPVDSRVAAVAVLTGEAKRRGLVSRFTAAAARAARGAAAAVLRAVRQNPGKEKEEEFPKWTPPVIPGGPELKLYRISPGKRTKTLMSSRDIAAAFAFLAFQHNEEFWIALLDSRNRIIGRVLMTRGTVGQSPVYPSEIMRVVLHSGVHRFAAAHCHPSGFTEPSPDDIALTKHIIKACALLGDIKFVDHVIVGDVRGTPGAPYGRPAHGATPEAADQAHGVAEKMAAVEGQPVYFTSLGDAGLM